MKTAFQILLAAAFLPAAIVSADEPPVRPVEPAPLPIEVSWRAGENTQTDRWYNLSNNTKSVTFELNGETETRSIAGNTAGFQPGNFPTFGNATQPWPRTIDSQVRSNSGSTATLRKVANGQYGAPIPSGASMYFFSTASDDPQRSGGTLGVASNAVSGLNTILFQVSFGEGLGYDFAANGLPTLKLKFADGSSSAALGADYSTLIDDAYNGTDRMPVGPGGEDVDVDVYINLHGFQWDLSPFENGSVVHIESFEITFSGAEHAQLYYMQLDQSSGIYRNDIFVPEPSTYALILGAGVLGLIMVRRRRAK